MFLKQKTYQHSESIDSIGFNGGSGWTRTTDLTLISSATYLRNTIKSMLSEVWYARGYAQILLFSRVSFRQLCAYLKLKF